MTATCDRTALEHAIVREPHEDTPRLAYADWLEEHGEHERAELIRLGCQLASWGCEKFVNSWQHYCREGRRGAFPCHEARERERGLLLENWSKWVPYLEENLSYELVLSDKWEFTGHPACFFSRGFPSKVVLPNLLAWERWGEAIVRAAPVTEIVVSCREPWRYQTEERPDVFSWWRGRENDFPDETDRLPDAVWKRVSASSIIEDDHAADFTSREQALSLAARAFCDEARSKANLPPVWSKP